jgi:ATP adenylyltransferase
MEKLWSPWRSKYIDAFNEGTHETECIFCKMLYADPANDQNLVIDQAEYTLTVLNLYPYNTGHLMVVPKHHTSEFYELTNEELLESMKKLQLAQQALTRVSNPHGFNIGANIGRISGAGIEDHIHFHIVPRWIGDTNFMPVLGEVKVISQDLLDTKHRLIQAYQELKSK